MKIVGFVDGAMLDHLAGSFNNKKMQPLQYQGKCDAMLTVRPVPKILSRLVNFSFGESDEYHRLLTAISKMRWLERNWRNFRIVGFFTPRTYCSNLQAIDFSLSDEDETIIVFLGIDVMQTVGSPFLQA